MFHKIDEQLTSAKFFERSVEVVVLASRICYHVQFFLSKRKILYI